MDLIRLEFREREQKIGVISAMIARVAQPNKPKLLDQRVTSFGESITAFENIEDLALFNRNDYMDNLL